MFSTLLKLDATVNMKAELIQPILSINKSVQGLISLADHMSNSSVELFWSAVANLICLASVTDDGGY